MRKFKNKFAAIAAAAMTGVMTLGLVSAAAPVMGVYAEEGTTDTTSSDITITATGLANNAVSMVQGSDLTFTATLTSDNNAQFTWAVTNRPQGVEENDSKVAFDATITNKLVVANDATVGEYIITATTGSGENVKTQTVTVTVKAPTPEDEADVSVNIWVEDFDGDESVSLRQGGSLQFAAEVTKDDANVENAAVTWSVTGPTTAATGVTIKDGLLTVGESATTGTWLVNATATIDNVSYSADPISVEVKNGKDIETAEYSDSGYSLYVNREELGNSNYIYVAYYSDQEGKKLKSTVVYERDEVGNEISLGGLNLKKGASFQVYSEQIPKDIVKLVVIPEQSGKLKVKVNDLEKKDLLSALTITVGSTVLTNSNYKDYAGQIYINGRSIAVMDYERDTNGNIKRNEDGDYTEIAVAVNNSILEELKLQARMGGATFYAEYYEKDKGIPTEAKFKISAAAKAPAITVDYVNGTYKLKKGVSYTVVNVEEDGSIGVPGNQWTVVDATAAKTAMSADDIIKKAPTVYTPAKRFVEGTTYYTQEPNYVSVEINQADFYNNRGVYYVLATGGAYESAGSVFNASTTYYVSDGFKYSEATPAPTNDNFIPGSYYVVAPQKAAAIIVKTPAKKSKMESVMTVEKIEKLAALDIENAADGKTATVKFGNTTVTTLTFTESGVTMSAAGKDFAYYDSSKSRWTTVKATKAVTKAVTLPTDGLQIKVLGVRGARGQASSFGSATAVITKPAAVTPTPNPEAPTAKTVVEPVTNLDSFKPGTVYYSDQACTTAVDTSVSPTSNITYYVKVVYTPVTATTPAENTTYYTTENGTTFTAATVGNAFTEGTTYYTKENAPVPNITSVTITVMNGTDSVSDNDSISSDTTGVLCKATVTGDEGVAQTVKWSVALATGSEGTIATTIDPTSGVIEFKAADENKTIVITAISLVDSTKKATFSIQVTAANSNT